MFENIEYFLDVTVLYYKRKVCKYWIKVCPQTLASTTIGFMQLFSLFRMRDDTTLFNNCTVTAINLIIK